MQWLSNVKIRTFEYNNKPTKPISPQLLWSLSFVVSCLPLFLLLANTGNDQQENQRGSFYVENPQFDYTFHHADELSYFCPQKSKNDSLACCSSTTELETLKKHRQCPGLNDLNKYPLVENKTIVVLPKGSGNLDKWPCCSCKNEPLVFPTLCSHPNRSMLYCACIHYFY